jgi:hypothetical protein
VVLEVAAIGEDVDSVVLGKTKTVGRVFVAGEVVARDSLNVGEELGG